MQKMHILSNSAKFSAGRPLLPAYNFWPQWPLHIIFIVWGLWPLNFLAPENIPSDFLAHVYYGQMARWIRIPLFTEVGLGPCDIVLDVDPAPPPCKMAQQPHPRYRAHCSGSQTRILP